MAEYEVAVYSDDMIPTAKADVAALRKLKKAIEDKGYNFIGVED